MSNLINFQQANVSIRIGVQLIVVVIIVNGIKTALISVVNTIWQISLRKQCAVIVVEGRYRLVGKQIREQKKIEFFL